MDPSSMVSTRAEFFFVRWEKLRRARKNPSRRHDKSNLIPGVLTDDITLRHQEEKSGLPSTIPGYWTLDRSETAGQYRSLI